MAENEDMTPVINPIDHLLDRLNVDTVFGAPTHMGDVTIIPVAAIRTYFGFGYGGGPSDEGSSPPASGGGGGGAGTARPMGYVRVAPDGVQYEAMVDPARYRAGRHLPGRLGRLLDHQNDPGNRPAALIHQRGGTKEPGPGGSEKNPP